MDRELLYRTEFTPIIEGTIEVTQTWSINKDGVLEIVAQWGKPHA